MKPGFWAMQRLMEYPIIFGIQGSDLRTYIEEGWFRRASIWLGRLGLSSSFVTNANHLGQDFQKQLMKEEGKWLKMAMSPPI